MLRYFFYLSLLVFSLIGSGCQGLFYYPTDKLFFTPEMFDLKHENVYFQNNQGEQLHGWFLPSTSQPSKGTILYFHGNSHNISHFLISVIEFPVSGYNLFTFDYQGYGLSDKSNVKVCKFNMTFPRQELDSCQKIFLFDIRCASAHISV